MQLALVAPVVQMHVEALQHTPGHGLGEQVLDGPMYVSPAGQPVTSTAVQMQLPLQHEPGQGLEQVLKHVKVPTHAAEVVTLQTPVVMLQHLPVQGDGEQTPPQ